MIDLDTSNGKVLRYGITLSTAVLVLGLAMHVLGIRTGTAVMTFGIGLMISVPFLGILTSVLALYSVKDRYWLRVALLLTLITAVGMAVAYF